MTFIPVLSDDPPGQPIVSVRRIVGGKQVYPLEGETTDHDAALVKAIRDFRESMFLFLACPEAWEEKYGRDKGLDRDLLSEARAAQYLHGRDED